jgi:hypothetical protein
MMIIKKSIIEPFKKASKLNDTDLVYDFELMQNGGHIKGYKLNENL